MKEEKLIFNHDRLGDELGYFIDICCGLIGLGDIEGFLEIIPKYPDLADKMQDYLEDMVQNAPPVSDENCRGAYDRFCRKYHIKEKKS